MKLKIIYGIIWKNRAMIDFRSFLNSIMQYISQLTQLN